MLNKLISAVVCAQFMLATMVITPAVAVADQPTVPTAPALTEEQMRAQVTELRDSMLRVFENEGSGSLLRSLKARAEGGMNLDPLREEVLKANGGEPQDIEVRINEEAQPSVDFANRELKKSGIDFFRFKAIHDNSLLSPTEPRPSDLAVRNKWRAIRSTVIPLIGFAATLADARSFLSANGQRTSMQKSLLAGSLARAFAVLGLELQFSMFSNWWAKWWESKPLVSGQIPMIRDADSSRIKQSINRVTEGLNKVMSHVERGPVLNFLVNWGYTIVLYSVGIAVPAALGLPHAAFSLIRLVLDTGLMNTAFYFAFGLGQVALSSYRDRGEISELQRFQIESSSSYWNAFWRVAGLAPALKTIALTMQLAFGALTTLPMLARLKGADAYADKTRVQFDLNAGRLSEEPRGCRAVMDKVLAGLYEVIPFRKNQNMWGMLKETRKNVSNIVRSM